MVDLDYQDSESSSDEEDSRKLTKRNVGGRKKSVAQQRQTQTRRGKDNGKNNHDAVSLTSTLTELESKLERVSGRYEDKKGENEELKQRVAALEGEVRNAQRRMEMVKATSSCSQPAKKMTDEMKNLDLQYNGIMIETVIRLYKFPEPGMEQWSDDKDCVARMVVDKIHFPAETTMDQKREIWEMFLSAKLRRKIQVYRGKLVQAVKAVFTRELYVWLVCTKLLRCA